MLRTTVIASALWLSTHALGQADWEEPFPPHQMIDNIYYVGTSGQVEANFNNMLQEQQKP